MMKRALSGFLAFAVLIMLLSTVVMADDPECAAFDAAADTGDFLEDADQVVYSGLAEKIQEIAVRGGSTEVLLDVRGKGVDFEIEGTAENGAYTGRYCIDVKKIILALMRDYPYEMYWYDASQAISFGTKDGIAVGLAAGTKVPLSTMVFSIPVGIAYQDASADQPGRTVSAQGVAMAEAARKKADAVVDAALRLDTIEQRLRYCFDYVKANVSYDDSRSDDSNTWQLIWVFDQDTETNVVCEGYAKAFKYLCDGIGVENYLVSGTMTTPAENGEVPSVKLHMWNIVVLDGKNYLVDVTNCDESTVGADEELFMKAPDEGGSVEKGYTFTNAHHINYVYDDDTIALFGDSNILTLSSADELRLGVTTVGNGSNNVTIAAISSAVNGTTAIAEISDSMGREILSQTSEKGSAEFVIEPLVADNMSSIKVSVPASLLESIGTDTDAAVTMRTPLGDVCIANDALSDISGNGGTVSILVEAKANQISLKLTAGNAMVSNDVILRVPCQSSAPGMVAVLIREDGAREVVRKSVAVDGVLTVPMNGSCVIEIVDNTKPFSDVGASAWYNGAVAFASSHLLFSGTSETTFAPDGSMTRGMLAKVLHNMDGNPAPKYTGSFSDVEPGSWYETAVLWAAGEGIVSGYSNGLYGPNDDITREQLAVMLWRYCGSPKSNHSLRHFDDQGKISAYAREAMAWANENGIINGNGGGQLDPLGKASRAQVAQMLKNLLECTAKV